MNLVSRISSYRNSTAFRYLFDIVLFVVITIVIHKLWWKYDGYIYSIRFFQHIAHFLAYTAFGASAWIDINIFQMDLKLSAGNLITFSNHHAFYIDESCSAFKQMFQLFILLVFFPGPLKHKLWFIPFGLFSMFVVNVLRIIGLSFTMLLIPQHWDFVHLWVMRPLFYVWIFTIWVIWVEKFRMIGRPVEMKTI